MKLSKKYIKNLSKDKKSLPLDQTHNVAGGQDDNTDKFISGEKRCIPYSHPN